MEQSTGVRDGLGAELAYVSLEGMLRLVWRFWLVVLVVTILGAAAGGAASWLITPAFRATTVLMPVGDRGGAGAELGGQLGGLAALAGISLGGSSSGEADLQYLKSREFVGAFIDQNMLLPVLFAEDYDVSGQRWIEGRQRSLRDGVRRFSRDVLSINEDKKTRTIVLSVVWRDPALAAAWCNQLVSKANEQLRSKAVVSAEANLAFLKAQLAGTDMVAMHQALSRLIETETREAMLARGRSEYAFKVIDPAVVPDRFDLVRPRRALMALFGGVFAGLATFVFVLFRVRRRAWSGTA